MTSATSGEAKVVLTLADCGEPDTMPIVVAPAGLMVSFCVAEAVFDAAAVIVGVPAFVSP